MIARDAAGSHAARTEAQLRGIARRLRGVRLVGGGKFMQRPREKAVVVGQNAAALGKACMILQPAQPLIERLVHGGKEAARMAGADEFVRALKNGYDTYVGERGVKLSGGQKQRISIARVFLKNPRILLLDEATSALDNESEILVGQSLDKLAVGRTTLTIAHRLTTIQNADRILVLGKDGIEEEGSHAELLARKGIYYRLWNGLVSGQTL